MNKRGTIRDVIWLGSFGLFATFLIFFIMQFFYGQIFNTLLAATPIIDSPIATQVINQGNVIFNNLDNVVIGIFITIILSFLITSWFTSSHPVLAIVYFIGGVIAILGAMLSSNIWEEITTTSLLITSLSNFELANHLMLNLPIYIGVVWFLGIIVTFAKPAEGGP